MGVEPHRPEEDGQEGNMYGRACLSAAIAAATFSISTPAPAGALNVVTVAAPGVNCVFSANCTITVTDSVGQIPLANLNQPNTAWLQSRTFTGAAGTPGGGKTGYEYRVDMTQASGSLECIGGIVVNFGPVTQLPYKNNQPADVYVITQGGLGTIGLGDVEKDGDVITFNFAKSICATEQVNAALTTFFFGLASANPPVAISAGVFGTGNPPYYSIPARAPKH
jgi:hypothetical protein